MYDFFPKHYIGGVNSFGKYAQLFLVPVVVDSVNV